MPVLENRNSAANEIVGSRLFDAPRELVWQMWTDPRHVVHWFGPKGFTSTIHEMDVRPGGVWRFVLHGPDGTDYQNKIVYREVVAPERLSYSHVSGPLFDAFITFSEEGGRTRVDTRMVFASAELRDKVAQEFGAIEGLVQTLDRLGEMVAEPFTISREFAAPRDLVFRVWTEPEHLNQWWGPKGFTRLGCSGDLRLGGMMHYGLQAPDGLKYWGRWIYRDIVPPERLVVISSFADERGNVVAAPFLKDWPQEILSVFTFEDLGERTRVTVEWRPINASNEERKLFAEMRESMQQGWTGTLDQLGGYLSQ